MIVGGPEIPNFKSAHNSRPANYCRKFAMDTPYSAEKDDLYYPAKHAVFFPAGRPKSDAALCAELSRLAYCNLETSFGFDKDRIRKVLAQVGFTDCQFFENSKKPDCEGTHCFLALEEDDKAVPKLAVVAFRGTDKDDPTDLAHDFNARPESWKQQRSKVHTGFAEALAEVEADVLAALQAMRCRVFFTGHSLGAAMATLLASLRPPDSLYTFGSPRVGDAAFVATLDHLDNHRYVDCCDIVTRVPPRSFGYEHLGDPYYIDMARHVRFNPPQPDIDKDCSQAEIDYLEHYSWRIGDLPLRPLADHAPVNYVLPVTADTP